MTKIAAFGDFMVQATAEKACSHSAKIVLKLVRLKEQKKYCAFLKHSNLAQFSPWRKRG
jgi:hypothetical protein